MTALARLPLPLKVPLIAAGLMVLLGVVASRQVLSSLEQAQESRIEELARLHVDGLSIALGPAVLRRDAWEVFDTLDRASRAMEGRMILTVVADDQGNVLAASDPRRAAVGTPLGQVAAGAQDLGAVAIPSGARHVRVTAPLEYQGREVGRIFTELDVADLIAERRATALYLLAGNALATLLLAAVAYVSTRRMLRPIRTLASHMHRGAGAPEAIPESEMPRGDDEMTRLFRTYNAMSGAVEAKAEAERRLAERERFVSLGRLASTLAHEINNPLGGLLNAIDTIRAYPDRPDVVKTSADLLAHGLGHLRDVARAMLDENRVARDGRALTAEDFEDLRLLFAPEAARLAQRLEWRVSLPRGVALPAAPMRQIALNLLLNASTAAGEGGDVALTVEGDAGFRMTVGDSGPGLPVPALQRLTSGEAGSVGGGVGLRLVRELTEQAGGDIAYRREGGRTLITVSCPAAAPC